MIQKELAIHGGKPTFPNGPPSWPIADDDILNSIRTALADGTWGSYESPLTEQLLVEVSSMSACEHVLLCSSGTIAVEIALRGMDIRAGSEVILAAYDFPGNFRAIEAVGARPVIVDVVSGGWVLDPKEVESAITPQTSAVIVSHLHGQFADCLRLREICEARQVLLLEDACQVPGGLVENHPAGSFGHTGVFSFGGSKLLSAGRGGAVVTNNADYFQRAKIFCNRGNEAFPVSQLQAAALLPQFEKLEPRNLTRQKNALHLIDATRELPVLAGLEQLIRNENILPAFYKVPWLIDDVRGDWTRDEFIQAAKAEGIAIDIGFRGFTRRSAKRCRHYGALINARIAAQQTIVLHHPVLLESEEIIEQVAFGIARVFNSEG